jgi:antitoxin component YwqK of YwqJK toxin-antitoxin module
MVPRLAWIALAAVTVCGALVLDEAPLPSVAAERLVTGANGICSVDGEPFSGHALTYERAADGGHVLVESVRYVEGVRHGLRMRWYPDGTLQSRTTFEQGKRHGVSDAFWEKGNRRSRAGYSQGRLHGVASQWYRGGELFKRRRLRDGREDGLQRAWRRDGTLYANYEARGGRNYGLNNAELCSTVGE